jgi:hypothetical protein
MTLSCKPLLQRLLYNCDVACDLLSTLNLRLDMPAINLNLTTDSSYRLVHLDAGSAPYKDSNRKA